MKECDYMKDVMIGNYHIYHTRTCDIANECMIGNYHIHMLYHMNAPIPEGFTK